MKMRMANENFDSLHVILEVWTFRVGVLVVEIGLFGWEELLADVTMVPWFERFVQHEERRLDRMIRRKGRNEDRKDSGRQQAVFDRVVFSGQWQDARSERHFRSIDAGLEKQKLCVNLAWELFTERLEGFKNEFVDEELKRRRRTCKEQTTMKTTYEHLKQFVELSIKAIVRCKAWQWRISREIYKTKQTGKQNPNSSKDAEVF